MLVEIDGYFDRMLLYSEKDLSEREMRKIYDQLMNEGIPFRELPGFGKKTSIPLR